MQITHHVLFPFDKKKKVEVFYWTTPLICLVFTSQFKFRYYDTIDFDKKKIKKFFNEISIWINDKKFRNAFKK